jgi:hypothetical protein
MSAKLVPHSDRTAGATAERIVLGMDAKWAVVTSKPRWHFVDNVFHPQYHDPTLDPDDSAPRMAAFLELARVELGISEPKNEGQYALMMLCTASAYCARALQLVHAGTDGAWSYIADAQYWVGHAYSTWRVNGGSNHAKGGDAIKIRGMIVGDFAFSQANLRAYPSKAEAVRKIRDTVMDFALREFRWSMSAMQAEKTIARYLTDRNYTPKASQQGA